MGTKGLRVQYIILERIYVSDLQLLHITVAVL